MGNKKDFLAVTSYTVVNHLLVKELGLNTAYFLAELISWDDHLDRFKGRESKEWFYYKQSYFEEKAGLSTQIQNRVSNKLCELGIIEKERRGIPPKNWYKINYAELQTYYFNRFKFVIFVF